MQLPPHIISKCKDLLTALKEEQEKHQTLFEFYKKKYDVYYDENSKDTPNSNRCYDSQSEHESAVDMYDEFTAALIDHSGITESPKQEPEEEKEGGSKRKRSN